MLRSIVLLSLVVLLVSSAVSQEIEDDILDTGDAEGCHVEPETVNAQFESPDIIVPLDPLGSHPSIEILQNLREFHPKNLAINSDE